nr:hypothetical protein [Mycoplasmopsis bovis]
MLASNIILISVTFDVFHSLRFSMFDDLLSLNAAFNDSINQGNLVGTFLVDFAKGLIAILPDSSL